MNYWLFCIPLISAVTGWAFLTGVKRYLTHVYLPQKQKDIASEAGHWAQRYVDTHLNLEKIITQPELIEKAMPLLSQHIDHFLNVKLAAEIPMLSMFIGNKTTDKIKEVFVAELKALFPQLIVQLIPQATTGLNVAGEVSNSINTLSIKKATHPALNKELKKLNSIGLAMGFFIGLINVVLFLLMP